MKTRCTDAKIETEANGSLIVWPHFENVDRPLGAGISCGTKHALAVRLQNCMKANKAFGDIGIGKDIFGKTYASYNSLVSGRHLNADLRRLGF